MSRPTPTAGSLPRSLRAPNPPAVFLGRDGETDWLKAALQRGPAAAIAGPEGIGKTALVIHALPRVWPSQRVLFVSLATSDPPAQNRLEVLRALAHANGADIDWPTAQRDEDALVDSTLQLAESRGWHVVVDGFVGADPANDLWLDTLAGYASKARFVLTTRCAPSSGRLLGQVIELGPLDERTMDQLARAWSPKCDETEYFRVIHHAAGSPLALQRLLLYPHGRSELAPLPPPEQQAISKLAALRGPLPAAFIEKLVGEHQAAGLAHQGLLLRGPGGLVLHSVARPHAEPLTRDEELALATELCLAGSPETTLAAVELLARLGATPRLRALLEERGERLLSRGYAPRLFSTLGEHCSSELHRWQLRCAQEMGNPTALAKTDEPNDGEPEDRILWATTLLARGRPTEALAVLKPIDTEELSEPASATCFCVLAEAYGRLGDLRSCLGMLAKAPTPTDPSARVQLQACKALWEAESGVDTTAQELGDLRRSCMAADPHESVWVNLAEALHIRGDLDGATWVLSHISDRPRGGRPDLWHSRRALLLRGSIAAERGDPKGAKELAAKVRPYAREPSSLAAYVELVDLQALWLLGELDGFEPRLSAAENAARGRDAQASRRLGMVRARWNRAHAVAPPATESGARGPAGLWLARHGALPQEDPSGTKGRPSGHQNLWTGLAHAAHLLAQGRPDEADKNLRRVVETAGRWTLAEIELEALALRCEALLAWGQAGDLAGAAQALMDRATHGEARLFLSMAGFFLALAEGPLRPEVAEPLAADTMQSPTVVRWARAALTGASPLDRADTALVNTMERALVLRRPQTHGVDLQAESWQPCWGLDLSRRLAWLPSGRTIPLGGKPAQWRLLETLACSRELRATKEELALRAWNESEYHPLKHDGKLYVAVRKLRSVLEDNPSAPTRLCTADDGYALGVPARIVGAC